MTFWQLVLCFIGAIAIVVMKNRDEKRISIAMYGYDPVREKYSKLPQYRKDIVNKIREDKRIAHQEYIMQITRRGNENLHKIQEARGNTAHRLTLGYVNTLPPLESFQAYANGFPPELGKTLMNAARAEAHAEATRTYNKQDNYGKDYLAVRDALDKAVAKCEEYSASLQ